MLFVDGIVVVVCLLVSVVCCEFGKQCWLWVLFDGCMCEMLVRLVVVDYVVFVDFDDVVVWIGQGVWFVVVWGVQWVMVDVFGMDCVG